MLNTDEVLGKLGYRCGEKLGSGAFAQVFELVDAKTGEVDPTRVIKLTWDDQDAKAAELARKAQVQGRCNNIVKVHRVIRAGDPRWSAHYDRYVIISERLQKIPPEAYIYLPDGTYEIDHRCCDFLLACDYAAMGDARPSEWAPRRTNVWSLAALNAKGMADDLRSLGCEYWEDFKLTNVMLRPGDRVVVSDLGCIQSPPTEIEELAA